jgi:hypothetical protein
MGIVFQENYNLELLMLKDLLWITDILLWIIENVNIF